MIKAGRTTVSPVAMTARRTGWNRQRMEQTEEGTTCAYRTERWLPDADEEVLIVGVLVNSFEESGRVAAELGQGGMIVNVVEETGLAAVVELQTRQ